MIHKIDKPLGRYQQKRRNKRPISWMRGAITTDPTDVKKLLLIEYIVNNLLSKVRASQISNTLRPTPWPQEAYLRNRRVVQPLKANRVVLCVTLTRTKGKSLMVISLDEEKNIWQNSTCPHDSNSGMRSELPQPDNCTYENPEETWSFMVREDTSPPRWETRPGVHSYLLVHTVLYPHNKGRKRNERHRD